MAVFLNENCLVSSLEEMSRSLMPFIKELRIDAVQLAHAEGKIAVGRFDQEMIVVIHETVSVTDPVIPFIDMLKRVQKANAIMVVFKDSFLLIAARGDMIDCAGVFNAKGTGHAETLAEKMGNVKIKDLTLRCS
jgi:hypothetical protein